MATLKNKKHERFCRENKMIEQWKDIEGYNGLYQVSNYGYIKSFPKKNSPDTNILTASVGKNGYKVVRLCSIGGNKTFAVHKLVVSAFQGIMDGKDVNHKDCDKTNNNIKNLEQVTRSENMKHAFRNNLLDIKRGSSNPLSKLTEEDVRTIRIMAGTNKEIAERFNVDRSRISLIKNRKIWKHVS